MNSKTLLASGILICLLASCKKNNSNSSGNANKVKMYIEEVHSAYSNLTDTFSLSYDTQGRLTGVTSPLLKFVYGYNSNTSFTLDLFENGQLSIHEIAYIKNGATLDSTFQFNNTSDTTTEKYVYNGSLLTGKTTYSYSSGTVVVNTKNAYTYDNNSNLLKDIESDSSGNINTITTYTYTDKPLQFSTNPTYFPTQSKNLPATRKLMDGAGNVQVTVTYTYVFDSAGRVVKETDTADNGDYGVKSYTYF